MARKEAKGMEGKKGRLRGKEKRKSCE